ncbi:hypothetical protein J7J63_04520 [Candidatus Bipolaricaulota bacterium]|nr:hypothetical protein [Candidatus Bipolaricaulota bacterium]
MRDSNAERDERGTRSSELGTEERSHFKDAKSAEGRMNSERGAGNVTDAEP